MCYRYLQEIGYTDTIIDVRSARVRSLFGLSTGECNEDGGKGKNAPTVNGGDLTISGSKRNLETQQKRGGKKVKVFVVNLIRFLTVEILEAKTVDLTICRVVQPLSRKTCCWTLKP